MRHCKESLADRHLLGKIRTKINTDGIVTSHELDSFPRNSQGWRKITLQPGQTTLRITFAEETGYYWGKLAISSEPRMNETTRIHQIWTQLPEEYSGKPSRTTSSVELTDLKQEVLYVKYPLEDHVMMTMSNNVHYSYKIQCTMTDLMDQISEEKDLDPGAAMWVDDRHTAMMPHMLVPTKDRRKLYFILTDDWRHTNTSKFRIHELAGLDKHLEPGDRIKNIEYMLSDKNLFLQQLIQARGLKPWQPINYRNFVMLTELGHIYNLHIPKQSNPTLSVTKYPQLHSDLPPERIKWVRSMPNYLYVLTKDGEIYLGMISESAKSQGRKPIFQVVKMKKPVRLDSPDRVVEYTRLEPGTIPGKAKIMIAEAKTSGGKTILLTMGSPGFLPRECKTWAQCRELLPIQVRASFPYWRFDNEIGLAEAIDEEGELWIIMNQNKAYNGATYLFDTSSTERISEPMRTSTMRDKKCRALRTRAGFQFIAVEAEKTETKKK